MFDQTLPINRIVGNPGQAVRTAVDTVVDHGQMRVIPNLRAILDTQITGIAVNNLVILTDELSRYGHIMFIGGSHLYRVNQSAAGVNADVALHAEAPFIAFFRLMHLRVACFLRILCGAGRIENGGVHNRTALHHMAGGYHDAVDGVKEQLIQTVFLQQVPELAKRCLVRDILRHEINAGELTHGIAVVDRVLGGRIGEVEPDLQQIHPQHPLDTHGRTPPLAAGVIRRNDADPLIPRDNLVHDFEELFPSRFLLPATVFNIRKGLLFFHFSAPPVSS